MHPGGTGGVGRRGALLPAGAGGAGRVRAHRGQCRRGRADLPAAGRHPAGARTGRGPVAGTGRPRVGGAARRPVRPAHRWRPRRPATSADAARCHGLELSAPRARRAGRAARAGRVPRRLRPRRRRRSDRRRGRRPGVPTGRQVTRHGADRSRRDALQPAGDRARLRGRVDEPDGTRDGPATPPRALLPGRHGLAPEHLVASGLAPRGRPRRRQSACCRRVRLR